LVGQDLGDVNLTQRVGGGRIAETWSSLLNGGRFSIGMMSCININDLAYCGKRKHNGSVIPPSTKDLPG